jgi:hypothetical protein
MAKPDQTGPSTADIKRLFAHSGNRCAFPKCQNRLIEGQTVVGEICHIKAANPKGPRYDDKQSASERHGYDNLVLLCRMHHTVVDDDLVAYTVERLLSMKALHERASGTLTDMDASGGAQLLLSVNQSGGVAAHTIQNLNIIQLPAQTTGTSNPPSASVGIPFFDHGEVLANVGHPGEQEFTFDTEQFMYLRLIPQNSRSSVGNARVLEVFNKARPLPMNNNNWAQGISERNKYGAILFVPSTSHDIASFTQGFASGELWGMNNRLFKDQKIPGFASQSAQEAVVIPAVGMEQLFDNTLANYLAVVTQAYELAPPFMVEFGVKGIRGAHVGFPRHPTGYVVGPIFQESFRRVYPLTETTQDGLNAVLLRFHSEFYEEMLGRRRSDLFTDNYIAAHGLLQG